MQSVFARERLHALGPGIIAATAFGVGDAFAKVALAAGSDVLTLALCRGVVGVVILLCYLRIGAPPLPATPRERLIAFGLGVLFAAIVFGLFKAIQLITVQIAVLTYFIYPLLTGIGGAIFGVERLSWRGLLAAIVAFFGLALMIGAYPQGAVDRGLGLCDRSCALSHGVFAGRPHRAAKTRSSIDDLVFVAFFDCGFCHRGRRHLELAGAANRLRVDRGSHRQRLHGGCGIDALHVDDPHRPVPQRTDHESGAALGGVDQYSAAWRSHDTDSGGGRRHHVGGAGRVSAQALT